MPILKVKYLNRLVASVVQLVCIQVGSEVCVEYSHLMRRQFWQLFGGTLHNLHRVLSDVFNVLLVLLFGTHHRHLVRLVEQTTNETVDAFVTCRIVMLGPSTGEV